MKWEEAEAAPTITTGINQYKQTNKWIGVKSNWNAYAPNKINRFITIANRAKKNERVDTKRNVVVFTVRTWMMVTFLLHKLDMIRWREYLNSLFKQFAISEAPIKKGTRTLFTYGQTYFDGKYN